MHMFHKIRKLLGLIDTDCETNPTQRNSRKRSGNFVDSDENSQNSHNILAKYRRVNSDFPKYIPAPLEDYRQIDQQSSGSIINSYKLEGGIRMADRRNNYALNEDSDDEIEFNEIVKSNTNRKTDIMKKHYSTHHSINSDKKKPTKIPFLVSLNKKKPDNLATTSKNLDLSNFRPTSSSSFREKNKSIMERNYEAQDKMSYYTLLQNLIPSIYNDPYAQTERSTTNNVRSKNTYDAQLRYDCMPEIPAPRKSIQKVKTIDYIDLSSEDDRKLYENVSEIPSTSKNNHSNVYYKEGKTLPDVEPVNSLTDKLNAVISFKKDIVHTLQQKYNDNSKKRETKILKEHEILRQFKEECCRQENRVTHNLMDSMLTRETIILDDNDNDEDIYVIDEYPNLTEHQLKSIKSALFGGCKSDVVACNFNININREDLFTLTGENWLNDAIINYYMNLLMERGKIENLPKVYAMNTFFIPKLLQSGHAGLRRWTRKVDIFSYEIIPVPVHVGEVHWCMAIINFRNKTIQYYDSMGHSNKKVLDALEKYIKDESLDKKNQSFDTTGWTKESMLNCPKQENGSDCGVFSCMFAEFITRNSPISFGQQHMQYFRQKMIYEIISGRLLLE